MNKRTELYRQFIQEFKNSGKTEISFAENEVPLVLTLQYLSTTNECTDREDGHEHWYIKPYVDSSVYSFQTYLLKINLIDFKKEIISFDINNLNCDEIVISGLDFIEQELEYFIQKLK